MCVGVRILFSVLCTKYAIGAAATPKIPCTVKSDHFGGVLCTSMSVIDPTRRAPPVRGQINSSVLRAPLHARSSRAFGVTPTRRQARRNSRRMFTSSMAERAYSKYPPFRECTGVSIAFTSDCSSTSTRAGRTCVDTGIQCVRNAHAYEHGIARMHDPHTSGSPVRVLHVRRRNSVPAGRAIPW